MSGRRKTYHTEAKTFRFCVRHRQQLTHRSLSGVQDVLRSSRRMSASDVSARSISENRTVRDRSSGNRSRSPSISGRRPPSSRTEAQWLRSSGGAGRVLRAATMETSLLRVEAVSVAREEAALPYIGEPCEEPNETVEPEPPAPMGRHSEPERLEIPFEVRGVESAGGEVLEESFDPMLPGAAARDLYAVEFEVEVTGQLRVLVLSARIERLSLDRGREVDDVVERGAEVLRHACADDLLVLRAEVLLGSRSSEPFLTCREWNPRVRSLRFGNPFRERVRVRREPLASVPQSLGEHALQRRPKVLRAIDVPHLGIEAEI